MQHNKKVATILRVVVTNTTCVDYPFTVAGDVVWRGRVLYVFGFFIGWLPLRRTTTRGLNTGLQPSFVGRGDLWEVTGTLHTYTPTARQFAKEFRGGVTNGHFNVFSGNNVGRGLRRITVGPVVTVGGNCVVTLYGTRSHISNYQGTYVFLIRYTGSAISFHPNVARYKTVVQQTIVGGGGFCVPTTLPKGTFNTLVGVFFHRVGKRCGTSFQVRDRCPFGADLLWDSFRDTGARDFTLSHTKRYKSFEVYFLWRDGDFLVSSCLSERFPLHAVPRDATGRSFTEPVATWNSVFIPLSPFDAVYFTRATSGTPVRGSTRIILPLLDAW